MAPNNLVCLLPCPNTTPTIPPRTALKRLWTISRRASIASPKIYPPWPPSIRVGCEAWHHPWPVISSHNHSIISQITLVSLPRQPHGSANCGDHEVTTDRRIAKVTYGFRNDNGTDGATKHNNHADYASHGCFPPPFMVATTIAIASTQLSTTPLHLYYSPQALFPLLPCPYPSPPSPFNAYCDPTTVQHLFDG